MNLSNEEQEVVIYHEAGHAVVALLMKVPFERVSIEPQEDSLGHLLIKKWKFDDVNKAVGQYMSVLAAGMASAAIFTGDASRSGISAIGDVDNMKKVIDSGDNSLSEKEKNDLLVKFIGGAATRVNNNNTKPLIEAVARELLQRRTLSEDEVRAICGGKKI